MKDITVGYAFCGSFCTIKNSLEALKRLVSMGYRVKPIMSEIVYNTDTRFFKADELKKQVAEICDCSIIHDIVSAEPIGPKNLLDIIVVAPCTGNTIAKCALGITDTPVTMSVKAHLRNNKPVVLAIATNDGLSANLKNIAAALEKKNIYMVPFGQDAPLDKPTSLICDFGLLQETLNHALLGKQIQPLLL